MCLENGEICIHEMKGFDVTFYLEYTVTMPVFLIVFFRCHRVFLCGLLKITPKVSKDGCIINLRKGQKQKRLADLHNPNIALYLVGVLSATPEMIKGVLALPGFAIQVETAALMCSVGFWLGRNLSLKKNI